MKMSTKYAMISWFILLLCASVNSKMCTRKTMVMTHKESFDWELNRSTTTEPKYVTKLEEYNCDVLNKSDDYYDTSTEIIIEPIDYTLSVAECDPPCNNGVCVEHMCECYMDYILVDGTCQATCSKPCYNGTCVSPDYCECNPGYRTSGSSGCEPICSSGCQNGLCVAPETCQCKPGYIKELIGLSYVCTPDCRVGYTKINGICTPKCKACDNGECTAPDVCTCSHGYKMNFKKLINPYGDDASCIPSCVKCVGRCIAPNTCQYDVTVPTHFGDVTFSRTVTTDPTTEVQTTTPMPTTSDATTLELGTTDISDATSITVKTAQPTIIRLKPIQPTTTSVKTVYFSTTTEIPTDLTTVSAKLIDLMTSSVKTTYTTTTLVKTTYPTTIATEITHSTTDLGKNVSPSVTRAFTNAKSKLNCEQDSSKQTWVEQYWTFILWPILALAIALIIILLAWRRKSVVYFFIGKNYVVNGNVAHEDRISQEVYYNKKDENVDCLKELI